MITDDKGKLAESKDKKNNAKPRCVFSSGEHYSDLCAKFADYHSRQEVVKELKLCSRCSRKWYLARDCTRRVKPCFDRKGYHAGAVCGEKEVLKGINNSRHESAAHSVQTESETTAETETP